MKPANFAPVYACLYPQLAEIATMAAKLAESEKQLAEAMNDAERYRYLRKSGANWIEIDIETDVLMSIPNNYDWQVSLDAAIDAAIRAMKEE